MKRVLFLVAMATLSGCASNILENKEKEIFVGSKPTEVEPTDKRVGSLQDARDLALRLSAAYYAAANESQNTQDAINIITN